MSDAPENVVYQDGCVTVEQREKVTGQRGCVVWMTGLSGSGKSTIARALELELVRSGRLAYILDGDNLRHGISSDLGFEEDDRAENVRRTGEIASILADTGVIVLTAMIAPFRDGRESLRKRIGADRFFEVFIDAPLEVCAERDPKGLYQKVRNGEIEEFTGIDSPYEPPPNPDLHLRTAELSVEQCVDELLQFLEERAVVPGGRSGER